jgi:hypothetical protein
MFHGGFWTATILRTRFAVMYAVLAVALGALDPPSQRIAAAQAPEETPRENPPATFTEFLKQQWARPQSDEIAPDTAGDTINAMKRARGRASGTPEPEPTPKW